MDIRWPSLLCFLGELLLVGISVPGPLFLLPVFLGPGGILALRDPDTVLGAAIGQVRIAHR